MVWGLFLSEKLWLPVFFTQNEVPGFIRNASEVPEIFLGSSWAMLLLSVLWPKRFFLVSSLFLGYDKQDLSYMTSLKWSNIFVVTVKKFRLKIELRQITNTV